MDVFAASEATRDRIISVALDASDGELGARVPSCPEWTAHDLVAHCAGIPTALTTTSNSYSSPRSVPSVQRRR